MKKLLLLVALLSPVALMSQGESPKKNKMGVLMMRPGMHDHSDFERNLAHHNKEYHTGEGAVDIFEVVAGDRYGEYHFVFRNLFSWKQIDAAYRAVEEKSHAFDWDMNVTGHLTQEGPFHIFEQSDDSYMPANLAEFAGDLWGVYFIEIKMGMEEDFFSSLKKIREMYQKNNSKNYYSVLRRVFGNGTQVAVAFPLVKGWESFEPDPSDDWTKMFKNAFPKEDYKAFMTKLNNSQKSFESFVAKYRKDLSSPM